MASQRTTGPSPLSEYIADAPVNRTRASHLARATGISTAAATGLVDRLEVAGYVTRVPDSNDRRRTIVRLQPERLAAGVGPTFLPLLQRWNKALAGHTEAELLVAAEVPAAMIDCIGDAVTTLRRPADP